MRSKGIKRVNTAHLEGGLGTVCQISWRSIKQSLRYFTKNTNVNRAVALDEQSGDHQSDYIVYQPWMSIQNFMVTHRWLLKYFSLDQSCGRKEHLYNTKDSQGSWLCSAQYVNCTIHENFMLCLLIFVSISPALQLCNLGDVSESM